MSDTSSMSLDSSILMPAISTSTNSVTAQKAATVESAPPKSSIIDKTLSKSTASQDSSNTTEYAKQGDSKYNSEMDLNGSGSITNREMTAYYEKISDSYGSNLDALQIQSTSNIATKSQAANAYAANNASYKADALGSCFIKTSA